MKKDRNSCMYPTYPMPYMGPMNQGMMVPPGGMMMPNSYQGMMMPSSYQSMVMPSTMTTQTTTDMSSLTSQINSLEKRVTNLENLIGNSNTYNTSTYQMM